MGTGLQGQLGVIGELLVKNTAIDTIHPAAICSPALRQRCWSRCGGGGGGRRGRDSGSGIVPLRVHGKAVAGPAVVAGKASAPHVALRRGDLCGACIELVTAVALSAVFHAKVRVALAKRSAAGQRHVVVGIRLAAEGPASRSLCIAADGRPAAHHLGLAGAFSSRCLAAIRTGCGGRGAV